MEVSTGFGAGTTPSGGTATEARGLNTANCATPKSASGGALLVRSSSLLSLQPLLATSSSVLSITFTAGRRALRELIRLSTKLY